MALCNEDMIVFSDVHIEIIENGALVSKQESYGGNKFRYIDLTLKFFFYEK